MNTEVNQEMIVLARETRGLTQQDLADKLNRPRANVSRLENGDTNVQHDTLLAISIATHYPPQFFSQQGKTIPVNLAYRKRDKVHLKLLTPIEAKMNIIRRHVQFVTRALDKVARSSGGNRNRTSDTVFENINLRCIVVFTSNSENDWCHFKSPRFLSGLYIFIDD